MQYIKKTALCSAIAAMAFGAHAATITLDAGLQHDGSGSGTSYDDDVVYDVSGLEVDGNGAIVVRGVTHLSGMLPGFTPGDLVCGTGTVAVDSSCEPNWDAICTTGTAVNEAGTGCESVAPPDETPPTVTVSSNRTTFGDGVTNATITFTFSEAVQGFTAADVTATGGSIGALNPVGSENRVWTAPFTRAGNTAGSGIVRVLNESYEDMSNNLGSTGAVSLTFNVNEPDPTPVGCDATPSGTSLEGELFDWAINSNQTNLDLTRNGVHAYPFTTTSNPAFNGRLSVLAFSNTQFVNKDVWFSECPGGDPLPERTCHRNGNEFTMYWEQNTASARCSLEPNTTYYINVQNVNNTCSMSSGCDAKLQHLVIGSPN